jgi:tyrosyl-tRNA synthetase
MQRCGHRPIAIAGGGTGLVGDPSGKTQERQLLTREQVAANLEGIRGQLARYLDFEAQANSAKIVDNADWLGAIGLMDFLRDVGKYFTVNWMLAKDSVKRRLEGEEGISFTEFSYMLLQAYDFLVLYDREGCALQMGGSDQWGNIVAGVELIRKLRGGRAYGLVCPLVTTASGVKFGKTEAGAVWLDPGLTSPYAFYQFWVQTDDRDVVRYLKFFTWLGREEIAALERATAEAPARREAQRRLAAEVTRAVHGEGELAKAERASAVLFGEEIGDLGWAQVEEIFRDVPSSEVNRESLAGAGTALADLLVATGLASSKADARRAVEGGGIYLNNRRLTDPRAAVTAADAVEGRALVLRKGRKSYHLVRVRGG